MGRIGSSALWGKGEASARQEQDLRFLAVGISIPQSAYPCATYAVFGSPRTLVIVVKAFHAALSRQGPHTLVELCGLQRPGDLVSVEDNAGRHCLGADEIE